MICKLLRSHFSWLCQVVQGKSERVPMGVTSRYRWPEV
jgi:hypothetical protein